MEIKIFKFFIYLNCGFSARCRFMHPRELRIFFKKEKKGFKGNNLEADTLIEQL